VTPPSGRVGLRLRIGRDAAIAMGPGKADLLEAIDAAGSISAAARALGMSYRRAWLLVEEMNGCFAAPLVETHPGARTGARLSAEARVVLATYREAEAAALAAATEAAAPILAALKT